MTSKGLVLMAFVDNQYVINKSLATNTKHSSVDYLS